MTAQTASQPAQGIEFYVLEDPSDSDHGHHIPETGTMLGFWIYLMSDCVIFGALFATYALLGGNYSGGPAPKEEEPAK